MDTLKTLEPESAQTCVTSPPYFGLRSYIDDEHEDKALEIGLEPTPDEYVQKLVEVFREVRRVLKDDGVLWLNLGDSYAGGGGHSPNAPSSATSKSGKYGMALKEGGIKPKGDVKAKDLVGIPWMVAFALRADGWYLRSDIIWHKPNPMPESVTDRPTKSHEYIFLLSKSERYFYDHEAIKEPLAEASVARYEYAFGGPKREALTEAERTGVGSRTGVIGKREATEGRNKRTVWTVATKSYSEAHFATFPPDLIRPCILAGSAVGDTVLDPFNGAATTGLVALQHGRNYIGCELNPEYIELSEKRLKPLAAQPRLLELV